MLMCLVIGSMPNIFVSGIEKCLLLLIHSTVAQAMDEGGTSRESFICNGMTAFVSEYYFQSFVIHMI